jgi:hypothetical protein
MTVPVNQIQLAGQEHLKVAHNHSIGKGQNADIAMDSHSEYPTKLW